jgi:hypothetical protein
MERKGRFEVTSLVGSADDTILLTQDDYYLSATTADEDLVTCALVNCKLPAEAGREMCKIHSALPPPQPPPPAPLLKRKSQFNRLVQDEIKFEDIKFGPKIGQGAFGEVFKGILYGQEIAIKKLIVSDGFF